MFFLWFRICAHLRHLWFKPAPPLGFRAGDNRPNGSLGGYEDAGLDRFVFSGCRHTSKIRSHVICHLLFHRRKLKGSKVELLQIVENLIHAFAERLLGFKLERYLKRQTIFF
jgi:hypothetical protein